MKILNRPSKASTSSCMGCVAKFSAALVCCVTALDASQGNIRAVFGEETPAPNVLVVIRSLANGTETGRYLTDVRGRVPAVSVESDVLYQVIGTCPYGMCETVVREAFGSALVRGMLLPVQVRATDFEGTMVGPTTTIVIRSRQGAPVSKLSILVRTPDAHRQRFYYTDDRGRAAVILPSDPAAVVVIVDHDVFAFDLASDCHAVALIEAGARCVQLQEKEIVLNIP
jgi:hypothetical protein